MSTNVVWDGDTGTATLTAKADGVAVNLAGATARHLYVRSKATGVVTELTISGSSDFANGEVTFDCSSLAPGNYDVILRLTDATSVVVTYPSADVGPALLVVRADMDAA